MTHRLLVTHPLMTVEVDTDENGVIGQASPTVAQFLGQPMERLFRWLESKGPGLEVQELGKENE